MNERSFLDRRMDRRMHFNIYSNAKWMVGYILFMNLMNNLHTAVQRVITYLHVQLYALEARKYNKSGILLTVIYLANKYLSDKKKYEKLCLALDIISRTHDILSRARDLISHVHDITSINTLDNTKNFLDKK